MIHTSRQLKALVRNISKGDSGKAQVIIRIYVMERFLERLSLSQYRNIMILKGGTLVAAMVGLDNRSTMDVDAPLKIDFSTGDVITPREVSYSFRLLFEERTISILAYNLETVLAEKLETLLARSTANTRMRDYYDIYVLTNTQEHNIDNTTLKEAFVNTSAKRGSIGLLSDVHLILKEVAESAVLIDRWKNYQRKFDYAADVLWADVMESVRCLVDIVK